MKRKLLLLMSGWLLVACGEKPNSENNAALNSLLDDKCYSPQKEITLQDKINWVELMTPAAQDAERIHGVPAAAIIAISSRESGYGNTKIYLNGTNAFGFKWTSMEQSEGRGYYVLACQPAADPNNKYIKFKNYWDAALFVGKRLSTASRYKATTDRYVQDRRDGVPVKTAVDRWIAGIADAGYNYDPATYKKHITQMANNYQSPSATFSGTLNLYKASEGMKPRSAE